MECELYILLYSALKFLPVTCVTLCTAATYSVKMSLSHNDVNAQPESIFQYCIKMRTISAARPLSRIRPPGARMTSVAQSSQERESPWMNVYVCMFHTLMLQSMMVDEPYKRLAILYTMYWIRFTVSLLSLFHSQFSPSVLILLCTNLQMHTREPVFEPL